ncbi:MAG: dethiobiotin synthase [Azonexus sp.]|jgi:dethiobiotin synthetase|nr:dethiobiotin synthase [Betaproteobacteria bacterium]MBK8917477.1 dethiobiotin synthase [Betaproteobacteria bacterium]MBP6036026.1 dethiobiotin synthase [Azonexus sp.]MBP6906548.1 dethiobiotin synthase [Azonexus sp.]
MKTAWFVTGTDTEVGKTYVCCALLHAARQAGRSAAGMKPVAAGLDAQGRNADVEQLRAASSVALPRNLVNPFALRAAVAPHIAAREEGRPILFAPIREAFENIARTADVVVVEGVGGFRVPLGEAGDSADLAAALGLPVILVVGLRLGCLNHALLTVEAIAARGLQFAGWIGNTLDPAMARQEENLQCLRQSITAPCLGIIPHAPPGGPAAAAAALRSLPGILA